MHDTVVNVSFSLDGLYAGEAHLVTVTGTYEHNSVTHGFTLDIPIDVPPPHVRQGEVPKLLASRVQVTVDEKTGVWTYTLLNDEDASDSRFINVFNLMMAAPFVVRELPKGGRCKLTIRLSSSGMSTRRPVPIFLQALH